MPNFERMQHHRKNSPNLFVGIWLSKTSPFVQEEDLLDPQDNDEVVAILQASGTLVAMIVKNFRCENGVGSWVVFVDIGNCLPREPNHNLAITTVVVANFVFRTFEMDGKFNEQNVCPNSEDKKPENGSRTNLVCCYGDGSPFHS